MAKKNNEVKENEELKEAVVTETTKKVEEPKTEEVVEENKETTVEDAKVEENASNEKQDAEVQATENKVPTVKEVFRDKYNEKVIYNVGDTFIEDETIEDNKPVEAGKGKYKVSKARYEELQRSLYVD
ncbi:MAG: hypothetical protein IJV31_02645 [Clostridia bacterium]|nr:hypothetical protein [Clostridia bacterium]